MSVTISPVVRMRGVIRTIDAIDKDLIEHALEDGEHIKAVRMTQRRMRVELIEELIDAVRKFVKDEDAPWRGKDICPKS
jgi:hypothetical protein